MKRIKDSHVGFAVGAAGITFLAAVIISSKVQKDALRDLDHPMDSQIVSAAVKRVHGTGGVPSVTDLPKSIPGVRVYGASRTDSIPVSHKPPVITVVTPDKPGAGSPKSHVLAQTDSDLVRARANLVQALKAVEKARTDLHSAVASRLQFVPRS